MKEPKFIINSKYAENVDADAVTLYPYIYFRMKRPDIVLIRHEYEHWIRAHNKEKKYGNIIGRVYWYVKYGLKYVGGWFKYGNHRDAYRHNHEEEIAYDRQHDIHNPAFVKWLKNTDYYKNTLSHYERGNLWG